MKSKVMMLTEFEKPLQPRELEIEPLEQGQILVRILAAGVCGSDVHMWKGEDPRTKLPIILGHEGVGQIVDIKGERVAVDGQPLRPGQVILWNRGISCSKCFNCTVLKQPALCEERVVYGIRFRDKPVLNGCYSEYIVLTQDTDIFVVDQQIDPAILVSASCSGATVAHGFDMVKVKVGDRVVIQGPGPLGVYACAFARKLGASKVVVIGGSLERLELCKQFGATETIDRNKLTEQERLQRVMELTNNRGADLVVEAVGINGAAQESVKFVRSGGDYISLGYAQPAGVEKIDFFEHIVRKNIHIHGVWVSDTSHTYQAMQLVLENKENFKAMITHRYKLAQANEALCVMDKKVALKAALIP